MTETRAVHDGPPHDTCEVWWGRTAELPADLVHLLSPAERERRGAAAGRWERDRFTAAAVLLRLALGVVLGLPPEQVPVDRSCPHCRVPHGRPRLPGGLGVDCSISHGTGRIAVAVCRGRRIGIDVEDLVEPDELDQVARTSLTPREWAALARSRRCDRPRAIAQVWTAKEAVLKATGEGLGVCPGTVEVRATRDGLRLTSVPPIPALARGAVLYRLRDAEAVATLAALGPEPLSVREHAAAPLYEEPPAYEDLPADRSDHRPIRTSSLLLGD